ncbi:hypothetical protein NN561_001782 [Cricetulus griseus]
MDYNSQKALRHSARRAASSACASRSAGAGCGSMAVAEAEVVSALTADSAGTAATPGAAAAPQAQLSKAALAAKLLSLSGVFAVHKPKGPTSAELLNRLKEKLLAGSLLFCDFEPSKA